MAPSENHWVADSPEDIPGWEPPNWLHIEREPEGRKIQDLLKTGDFDAQIISDSGADADTINKVTRRLWPQYHELEADYYRRTGIFPMRHVVVAKDDVLRNRPDIRSQLVSIFEAAKQLSYRYWADHRRSSLAWFGAEREEERP